MSSIPTCDWKLHWSPLQPPCRIVSNMLMYNPEQIICDKIIMLKLCATSLGAKVVTRAVFQMVSKSIFKRTAFEVHAVASTHGRTIKFKLTPPADVNVGE